MTSWKHCLFWDAADLNLNSMVLALKIIPLSCRLNIGDGSAKAKHQFKRVSWNKSPTPTEKNPFSILQVEWNNVRTRHLRDIDRSQWSIKFLLKRPKNTICNASGLQLQRLAKKSTTLIQPMVELVQRPLVENLCVAFSHRTAQCSIRGPLDPIVLSG